jgi:aldose 1-epimerase
MSQPPSGQQVELRHGSQVATIVEVGGGLREYLVDGQAVLDGYAPDEMASGGRGQILLPWPNRLADGAYDFSGQSYQLPIDEAETRTAIHGLVRWANWSLSSLAADRAVARLMVHPRPGYPFALAVEVAYALDDAGLSVHTTATNVGQARLPFGLGFHPYFTVGTPLVDAARLGVPAQKYLEIDTRNLPTGRVLEVAGSAFDFRQPRPIGDLHIDTCFTDLERDADGRAWISLSGERQVRVWLDAGFGFVQVFTGDTLVPERRRQGVAVEPMTCPANAFRSGMGLLVLEPEESFSGGWGLSTLDPRLG